MKKLLLIPFLLLMALLSDAQYIHKIKADSVLITNDSCNAELNLENSTKDTLGFLYNKGKGRTEFRRGLIKLNDSLYLIGGDTLKLIGRAPASGSGNYIQNQFQQKQTANAWIDTLKGQKLISSDTSGKVTTIINEGKIYITARVKDADTSTADLTKGGGYWGAQGGPYGEDAILTVSQPASRGSYDLWGGPAFNSHVYRNIDTFFNKARNGANLLYYMPNANSLYMIHRFKGYPSYPNYTLHTDDWRNHNLWLTSNFGKTSGSTGKFKATFGGAGWVNMLNYIDFNNNSGGNRYAGAVNWYQAGWQVNRADTFDNVVFYTYMINPVGSKTTGSGARNLIGYFAPALAASNTADRYWSFQQVGVNDKNYFAGQTMIGDSNLVNADVHKFYVNGSSKFSGNILQPTGRTILGGAVDDGISSLQSKGASKFTMPNNTSIYFESGPVHNGSQIRTSSYMQLNPQPAAGRGYVMIQHPTTPSLRLDNTNDPDTTAAGPNRTAIFDVFNLKSLKGRLDLLMATSGWGNPGIGENVKAGDIKIYSGVSSYNYESPLTKTNYNIHLMSTGDGYIRFKNGLNEVGRFYGAGLLIGDTSIVNLGSYKIYVNGASKFSGNILQPTGRTVLSGAVDDGVTALQVNGGIKANSLNLPASTAPTSSSDPSGSDGDIKRDASGNIYLRTSTQWLKFTGVTF
ncbi:hypothetical protein [Terrimonas alba]|uniref:hypothetical protein n=1 Tax=Terrimonas alba TaxID=3349636 RepID=UPI0035F424A0